MIIINYYYNTIILRVLRVFNDPIDYNKPLKKANILCPEDSLHFYNSIRCARAPNFKKLNIYFNNQTTMWFDLQNVFLS